METKNKAFTGETPKGNGKADNRHKVGNLINKNMKIESELFFKAKKDKNLNAFILIDRPGDPSLIRLCIHERSKYNNETNYNFIEVPTEIKIDNYAGHDKDKAIKKICFHESIYNDNHIKTFLDAIKKTSDVLFKVVAFNSCDAWKAVNFVSHQLYGIVDNKTYFLSTYIGNDNSASPIQY